MDHGLRACAAATLVCVVSACSSHAAPTRMRPRTPVAARASARLYRPAWVSTISADLDMLARCLEGREAPAFVVHVHHTADAVTVVTTVDAFEAVEACAVADGKPLVREPMEERLRDFEGLPLFALGARKPRVPTGARMQEVGGGGEVLGWLYWRSRTAGGDQQVADERALRGKATRRHDS